MDLTSLQSCHRGARSLYSDRSDSSRSYGSGFASWACTSEIERSRFKWLSPNELPYPGQNPIQTAKNLHGPGQAGRLPPRHGFQLSENPVEAIAAIGQHMIGIHRETVLRVDGSRGTTDQNSARQNLLKARG